MNKFKYYLLIFKAINMSQPSFIVTEKDKFNKNVYNIYKKNYSEEPLFTPREMYITALESDYWIDMLIGDNIVASCSISLQYKISDIILEECGFTCWLWEMLKNPCYKYISIWDVYVPVKFRNKGYGTKVLDFCLSFIEKNLKKKYRGVFLVVKNDNKYALKLYKKFFGNKPMCSGKSSSIYLIEF